MFFLVNLAPFARISSPKRCLMPLLVLPSRRSVILSMIMVLRPKSSLPYLAFKASTIFLDLDLRSLSFLGRENNLVSITTPFRDGEALKKRLSHHLLYHRRSLL